MSDRKEVLFNVTLLVRRPIVVCALKLWLGAYGDNRSLWRKRRQFCDELASCVLALAPKDGFRRKKPWCICCR